MKKELVDLKRVRDNLIGLEMELSNVEIDISAVGSDIDFLHSIQRSLVDNLNFLKKEKIITVASEFKKIKEDLKKVRDNLKNYEHTMNRLLKFKENILQNIEKNQLEFDTLERQIETTSFLLPFKRKDEK